MFKLKTQVGQRTQSLIIFKPIKHKIKNYKSHLLQLYLGQVLLVM